MKIYNFLWQLAVNNSKSNLVFLALVFVLYLFEQPKFQRKKHRFYTQILQSTIQKKSIKSHKTNSITIGYSELVETGCEVAMFPIYLQLRCDSSDGAPSTWNIRLTTMYFEKIKK